LWRNGVVWLAAANYGERPPPDLHRKTAVRPAGIESGQCFSIWLVATLTLLQLVIVPILPPEAASTCQEPTLRS
jgi:hypothetical protein